MGPLRNVSMVKNSYLLSRPALNWPAHSLSKSKFYPRGAGPTGPGVTSNYCVFALEAMAIDTGVPYRIEDNVRNYMWVRFHA